MKPFISIIITTKNEAANIGNCMKSVAEQTYPPERIEVIVVDNNSTDQTSRIVKEFPLPNVKLFDQGPERSAQRNFGVRNSSGEYFLYLDADMALDKKVVADCVERVEADPKIVALYISEIVMGDKFFSRVRRFERSFYDGTVIDCCRFIKKDTFCQAGGFDTALTGPEDWDLDKKLRASGKTGLIQAPIYHNEAEFELKKYLTKKGYYAKTMDQYVAKWGKNDPDIQKQFGVYYRFLGVFIENGKWKKMAEHPVLTAGMFFLRFLVGIKFLLR